MILSPKESMVFNYNWFMFMFMKNHVGISILDDMSPMDPLKNMLELQPTDLITI